MVGEFFVLFLVVGSGIVLVKEVFLRIFLVMF